MDRDNKGKEWNVFRVDPYPHESVAKSNLGKEDRAGGWVVINYLDEKTAESPPKLD